MADTLRLEVKETGYSGLFTASVDDPTVATISPASAAGPDATFTITPLRTGIINVSIADVHGAVTKVRYLLNVGPSVSYTVLASDILSGRVAPTDLVIATLSVANAATVVIEDPTIALVSLIGAAPATDISISPLRAGRTQVDVTDAAGNTQTIPIEIDYVAPGTAIPNLNIPAAYKPPNWLLLVYDAAGNLVDVPQADIESISVKRVLNGGPGQGTITFKRPFNQIGKLGFSYSFVLYLWRGGSARPAMPWWVGYQVDPQQVQLDTRGRVIVSAFGDAKRIDDAKVSAEVNPNVGGNPSLDAADFLKAVITAIQPAGFLAPSVPATMFPMLTAKWDHQPLGALIDDVCKMGRDSSGPLFIWRVVTNAALQRQIVVEVDQNPNVVPGTAFIHKFLNSQIADYQITTKYRDIVNLVAVYGDTDPVSGQQVYGVFEDATSVANVTEGRVIEAVLYVQGITSVAAAQAYAENWLKLNAYPQAQGSARIIVVDPDLQEGSWVQYWEAPAIGADATSLKQVRSSEVDLTIRKTNALEQMVQTDSPTPFLDEAIYRLGLNVKTQGAIANKVRSVNKQTLFVRAGGVVSGRANSPAKIALTPCEAVFPGVGIVYAAAFPLTTLTDDSGGPNNGQSGDGQYTISLTSAGTWIITKGDTPASTATFQNICSVWVNLGEPFATDIRTLAGQPAFSDILTAPTLKTGTVVNLGTPPNVNAGAYDQPFDFWLDPALWTNTDPAFAYLEIGAVPHGSAAARAIYTTAQPTSDGHYVGAIPGMGAGTAYDISVRGHDNLDRFTPWLVLGTTGTNPIGGPSLASMPAIGNPSQATAPQVSASAHGTATDVNSAVFKQPLTATFSDWAANAQPTWLAGGNLYRRTHGTGNITKIASFVIPSDGVSFSGTVELPAGEADDVGFTFTDQSGLHETPICWPANWQIGSQQIGSGTMQAMPALVLANGPTLSAAPAPTWTTTGGALDEISFTFTETDFATRPPWISKIYGVIRDHASGEIIHKIEIDPSALSAGAGSFSAGVPIGSTVDAGLYYTDLIPEDSTTVWPANWQNVADPNGAFTDPGGGGAGTNPIHYPRAPEPIKDVIGPTGQITGSAPFVDNIPNSISWRSNAVVSVAWTGSGPYNGSLTIDDGSGGDPFIKQPDGTNLAGVHALISNALAALQSLAAGNYWLMIWYDPNTSGISGSHWNCTVQSSAFTAAQLSALEDKFYSFVASTANSGRITAGSAYTRTGGFGGDGRVLPN